MSGTGGARSSSGGLSGGGSVNGPGAGGAGAAGTGAQLAGGAGNGGAGVAGSANGGGLAGASGAGGVMTGLPPDATVIQLSPADVAKICDAEARYADSRISNADVIRTGCVLNAAAMSGGQTPTVQACQQSVNACIANPSGISTMQSCSFDEAGLTLCTARVDAVEECATALIDAAAISLSGITCDLFALPPLELGQKLQGLARPPQSCAPLESTCPMAFKQSN